jgi:hypothetical protein
MLESVHLGGVGGVLAKHGLVPSSSRRPFRPDADLPPTALYMMCASAHG